MSTFLLHGPAWLAFAVFAACAAPGPVVSAPSTPSSAPAVPVRVSPKTTGLKACDEPWTLEDMEGGAGRVVVDCGSDVRRLDVVPGAMTRAIDPALGPARGRVCACASRLAVPAFLDLVVTSWPDEGRANVVAGEVDDELDAKVAPFASCVGVVETVFAPSHLESCGAAKAILRYPLRVDLQH